MPRFRRARAAVGDGLRVAEQQMSLRTRHRHLLVAELRAHLPDAPRSNPSRAPTQLKNYVSYRAEFFG